MGGEGDGGAGAYETREGVSVSTVSCCRRRHVIPLREVKARSIAVDKVAAERVDNHKHHAVEDGRWLSTTLTESIRGVIDVVERGESGEQWLEGEETRCEDNQGYG